MPLAIRFRGVSCPHEEQHHALRVELLFRERFLFLFDINQ
jgi:hypothetical protein